MIYTTSTFIVSSHWNKLLLSSPSQESNCLSNFLLMNGVKWAFIHFAGIWAMLPPVPLGTVCLLSSCDDALLFSVRLWGFAWLTCHSSKSPERQQNSAHTWELQNKGSYYVLYEPVYTADAIFTSASKTSSHLLSVGQESLNESLFYPSPRAYSLQRKVTWPKLNNLNRVLALADNSTVQPITPSSHYSTAWWGFPRASQPSCWRLALLTASLHDFQKLS